MNKTLAFINGIIITIMVLLNGLLAQKLGNYISLVIIYAVALSLSTIILIVKKDFKNIFKNIPFYLFFTGVIGVFNIFLNNVCVNNIGVALTVALVLSGQIIFSAVFEHFGFFGVMRKKLTFKKLPGYLLILVGAIVMIAMGV